MSSTHLYRHSPRPKGPEPSVILGRDSFDAQRDVLISIIHQHFDRSSSDVVNASGKGSYSSPSALPRGDVKTVRNGKSSDGRRKTSRQRKRTSINGGSAGLRSSMTVEVGTKKARKVLNIDSVESPNSPSHRNSHLLTHAYHNLRNGPYIRPSGPELVSPRHPSCSNLPPAWNYIHDRFIAYLATHAPLDEDGSVPWAEERRERWSTPQIVELLGIRFPGLFDRKDGCGGGSAWVTGGGGGLKRKMRIVENRLALLDEAGDNDYFQMEYGAYMYEEWGRGI